MLNQNQLIQRNQQLAREKLILQKQLLENEISQSEEKATKNSEIAKDFLTRGIIGQKGYDSYENNTRILREQITETKRELARIEKELTAEAAQIQINQ